MATFLTPEWLHELDAAARACDALVALGRDGRFVVEQRVDGGPSGEVVYHFVADEHGARVVTAAAEHPDVTVRTDHATAVALHRGAVNAQQMVASGALKVTGDVNELLRRADALRAIDDVFREVRATTTIL